MPKQLPFLLITLIFLLSGCAGNDMPSDSEMIANFEQNEAAFERLRELTAEHVSSIYPPFEEDSLQAMIPQEARNEMDSLLAKTHVKRVYTMGRGRIELLYHSWGLSVTGGSKAYVYAPSLDEETEMYTEEVAAVQTTEEKYYVTRVTEEDLNKVALRYAVNLLLYRPLRNNWYLFLERDRRYRKTQWNG